MFDMQTFKPRSDHAVCSVETGLHMIKAIKDVRTKTQVVSSLYQYLLLRIIFCYRFLIFRQLHTFSELFKYYVHFGLFKNPVE